MRAVHLSLAACVFAALGIGIAVLVMRAAHAEGTLAVPPAAGQPMAEKVADSVPAGMVAMVSPIIEVHLARTPEDRLDLDVAGKVSVGHCDVVLRNASDKRVEIVDEGPNPGDPDIELTGTTADGKAFTVSAVVYEQRSKTVIYSEMLQPGDVAVREVTFDSAQWGGWPALPRVEDSAWFTLQAKFKGMIRGSDGKVIRIESDLSPKVRFQVMSWSGH